MLRAGLFAFLVGPAAAGLTDECMKGLQDLEGTSDVELTLRCRAAFGPDACKQARQSLGAQPWTQASMQHSCHQFATAYEGMDERTLEAAVATKVATKTSTDATVTAKTPFAAAPVQPATPPAGQSQGRGPVANLLAKLKEKKAEEEAKANAVTSPALSSDKDKHGALAGLLNKMKEAKAAHEAQAKQNPAGAAAASDAGENKGPLAELINKIKQAKAAHEAQAGEVEQDQQGPLAKMFKQGQKAPVLKLYNEAPIAQPSETSRMPQVLGAFAGAAALAAVTLFAASRRAAPMSHEQLSEQLDAEQNVE